MSKNHPVFKIYSKGFTMIEMMVYLAIFLAVSTVSVTFLLSLDKFIDQYRLETMLYRSGSNSMENIMLALRQADQIDLVNTVEDDPDAGKLTLENSATTTMFALNLGSLDMEINGEDYGDLTLDSVFVDDFTVYYYSLAGKDFVRVKLSMTAVLDLSTTKSVTLYGGGVIRGAI